MRLEEIRIDGGTQARAKMNQETIESYAAELKDGTIFPPVVVFFDGKDHWLADGFNRYFANKLISRTNIDVEVRRGSILDAKLHACGANATHGQPRSHEDKRNAVMMVLHEPMWKDMSERDVANACNVSQSLVSTMKRSLKFEFKLSDEKKPAPKKTLPAQDVPEHDPLDDLRETIGALNEELEKASRAAAAGVLVEGMENAQEIMERQAREIKTLQAENDGLKAIRNTMQVEIKELKKQCAYYQKKMKESEK